MSRAASLHGFRRWLAALALSAAASLALAGYEPLILDLTVNQQARGEFNVYRDDAGDFLVRVSDLAALGLADAARRGPAVDIAGVPHLSLRSLAPQKLA